MIQIAVCDDNKVMLNYLAKQIRECFDEYSINYKISTFLSGNDLSKDYQKKLYDIVFLDIKMSDMNGFDVAKNIRLISEKTLIVFITTESSLVYESFDYQPFNFIPKGNSDVIKLKLKGVIKKLIDYMNVNPSICLNLPYGEKKYLIIKQIIYITSRSNYLDIIYGNETIHIRQKLNEIEKELPQRCFVRIHNRYLINLDHLCKIDNVSSTVLLDNQIELGISRSYRSGFLERYNIYLRNRL